MGRGGEAHDASAGAARAPPPPPPDAAALAAARHALAFGLTCLDGRGLGARDPCRARGYLQEAALAGASRPAAAAARARPRRAAPAAACARRTPRCTRACPAPPWRPDAAPRRGARPPRAPGLPAAQYRLALLLASGEAGAASEAEVVRLLADAAAQDHEDAAAELSRYAAGRELLAAAAAARADEVLAQLRAAEADEAAAAAARREKRSAAKARARQRRAAAAADDASARTASPSTDGPQTPPSEDWYARALPPPRADMRRAPQAHGLVR
jgi:hypothetical protein